jgi:hypothetical protein
VARSGLLGVIWLSGGDGDDEYAWYLSYDEEGILWSWVAFTCMEA